PPPTRRLRCGRHGTRVERSGPRRLGRTEVVPLRGGEPRRGGAGDQEPLRGRRPLRAGAAAALAGDRQRRCRSRRWGGKQLDSLAATLPQLGFEIVPPGLRRLASWAAAGLTAYDAAYLTVADEAGLELITDDAGILKAAPEIAVPLGG